LASITQATSQPSQRFPSPANPELHLQCNPLRNSHLHDASAEHVLQTTGLKVDEAAMK